jgi:hypothetical protein
MTNPGFQVGVLPPRNSAVGEIKINKLPWAYAHVTLSQAVLRTAGYYFERSEKYKRSAYIATLRVLFGRKLTSPR